MHIVMDNPERTVIRSAWLEFGANSAKNMDNEGGRPFLYPGKVPGYEDVFADVDRINPKYFDFLDRKIDYLNDQGFVPFIEVSRRDASQAWKRYYTWPDSYARFIEYVFARYQANNVVLSPIHFDTASESIPSTEFMPAIEMALRQHGPPPFGTLLTANPAPSTLLNWGDGSWVTLHQIGNSREHDFYWYLSQIFHAVNPQPALNGEPYYSGYNDARGRAGGGYRFGAPGNTEKDDQFVRSGMYGSFLSGGLAGHIYGSEAIWGADVQPQAPIKMWEAFQWSSATQMRHLRTFAFSIGRRYQDLIPDADWASPSKTQTTRGYEGWAYAAHTADKEIILAYFEKGCPTSIIRGVKPLECIPGRVVRSPRRQMDRCGRRLFTVECHWGYRASSLPRRQRLGASAAGSAGPVLTCSRALRRVRVSTELWKKLCEMPAAMLLTIVINVT